MKICFVKHEVFYNIESIFQSGLLEMSIIFLHHDRKFVGSIRDYCREDAHWDEDTLQTIVGFLPFDMEFSFLSE